MQLYLHTIHHYIHPQHLHEAHQDEMRRLQSLIENPYWVIHRDEVTMTQEILGSGGWGEVKVGVFRGTKVAVKCLHEAIISEHNRDLFSREMKIASHVRHPNLLQFIGATRVGNPIYILTELMPTSLCKELAKGPLKRCQILSISSNVSAALNYLHLFKPHPIIHRDVTSSNVLLEPTSNGQWKGKLSDFVSANLQHKIRTIEEYPGCPTYAAPESRSPNLHSPAMDVFSFGVLCLEMATCCLPSQNIVEREKCIQCIQWPFMKSLVEHCTIHDPQSRHAIGKVLNDINMMEHM